MDITWDASELDDLAGILQRARDRPPAERAQALDRAANRVRGEAIANAQSYTHGTGALASSIETNGTATYRRVFSDVREAFFLEAGSPSTGAPRAWLTGPAQRGADDLLVELGKIGDIW